jgi:hypothetical protein
MQQLRALGISAEVEAIYLDGPLGELAAIGLIECSGGKVQPRPPHLAMEALAQRSGR